MNHSSFRYPPSWYAASADVSQRFGRLDRDIDTDICVVGGGYTGLSAALHLAGNGHSVALVEQARVGYGASGRNGGQVGTGQRLDQFRLERMVGERHAKRLWQVSEQAKDLVASLLSRHNIACDYTPGAAAAAWKESEARRMRAYAKHLERSYGYEKTQPLDRKAFADFIGSEVFAGGVADWGAGHLHPLKFALGLARAAARAGAKIHELTGVQSLEEHADGVTLRTGEYKIKCRKAIIACNGYASGLSETIESRVMPINSFMIATEPLGELGDSILPSGSAVYDTKFAVNHYRKSADGRLIFGGGENYRSRFPKDIAELARRPMLNIYPQLQDTGIEYAWGGALAVTVNRMPCFIRPSPNVLSASGYSGHGVAMACMAGRILADTLQRNPGQFELFANLKTPKFPGGKRLRSIPPFAGPLMVRISRPALTGPVA